MNNSNEYNGRVIAVCHVITDLNIGGAGKHLYYLISASDKTKFRYTVILPLGSKIKPMLESAGAKVIEIAGFDRSYCPKLTGVICKTLKSIKPDIVHTHSSFTGRAAAKKAHIKICVMTKHCSDLPRRLFRTFPVKTLARLHFAMTLDAAIATDDSAARAMISAGVGKKKISVIYNGVKPLTQIGEEEKALLRKKLGIPENAQTIGIFGRLEKEKGHEDFLRMAALIARQTPSVYFIIVGDGSEREKLEQLSERFGIANRVIFCGFTDNIALYMSICKINVNTSIAVETSNQALSEGMSLGLIPVVTDIGGNRRMAEGCGITVPIGDPPAMADAIITLLRSPTQLKYSSEAAKAKFAEKYTADKMASQTQNLYYNLLRKRNIV